MAHKEFAVMKWVLVAFLSLTFGGIVAWFNISIFGADGAPYIAAIAALVAVGIITTKYTDSPKPGMRVAAFICEIALFAVLIVSVAYSISGLRELSLAKQVSAEQSGDLDKVGKLRGSRAQREAIQWLAAKNSSSKSVQAIFADYERPLFWLMIVEAALSVLTVFVMFGLSVLPDRNNDGIPDVLQRRKEFPNFIPKP